MLRAIRNWSRWSEVDEEILPEKILGNVKFEDILSIIVIELLLTLDGWSIWGTNKTEEDRESRNLFFDS